MKKSKRVSIAIVQQPDVINLESIQDLMRDAKEIDPFILYSEEDTSVCMEEIESWYDSSTPNYNLISHLGIDEGRKRLEKLRSLQPERKKIYQELEGNGKKILKKFVNIIASNPDILGLGRDLLTTERDIIDSARRKAAKEYRKSVSRIERAVAKEKERLKKCLGSSTQIYPISVKIFNPYTDVPKFHNRVQEYKTFIIKAIIEIIKPYTKKEIERAEFIGKVIQNFYDRRVDLQLIRKY